jgi:O-antigen biosynthesis protein
MLPDAISAVIPNRDGAHLLRRTLPPLLRELPLPGHEVLVVDDASQDDSLAVLRDEFPSVRVVALERNVGFGAACNIGFREARHDLVLLLNSDMEVAPGSVALLVEHFADPEVFAAGPGYRSDDPAKPPPPKAPRPSWPQMGAPAGGGLFRREVFLELGGFDPLYAPFYWEDVDLGWNSWRRGWHTVYDSRCEFLHLESATIRRLYSPAYVGRIRARNRLLFACKNLHGGLWLRFVLRAKLRALSALVRRGDASGITGELAALPRLVPALCRRTRGGLPDSEVLRASSTPLAQLLQL